MIRMFTLIALSLVGGAKLAPPFLEFNFTSFEHEIFGETFQVSPNLPFKLFRFHPIEFRQIAVQGGAFGGER